MSDSDARRARLHALQARMGDSARANRRAVAAEHAARREAAHTRETPGRRHKLSKAARILEERDIAARGEDVGRHRALTYSIEENERWEAHLAEKERRRDKGLIDYQDLAERSYQRQVAGLRPDKGAYAQQQEAAAAAAARPAGDAGVLVRAESAAGHALVPAAAAADVPPAVATYGQHRPSSTAVDRLVSHLNHEQDHIRSRSRARADDPDAEVNYINKRNKHFNHKIERYYDEYTREIRENLERGTAL